MIGHNRIHPRPFAYFHRNVSFISFFLIVVSSGIFEVAYAQESSIMKMLDKASSARIVDLTENRSGTIWNMGKFLHGADRIQIVQERNIALISKDVYLYIFRMNETEDIVATKIDICKVFPWICITNPHTPAGTIWNQPMQ